MNEYIFLIGSDRYRIVLQRKKLYESSGEKSIKFSSIKPSCLCNVFSNFFKFYDWNELLQLKVNGKKFLNSSMCEKINLCDGFDKIICFI